MRYDLTNWLLQMGHIEDAGRLMAQFAKDTSAPWLYSKALYYFVREGDSPRANRVFRDALVANPHVPEILLFDEAEDEEAPSHYAPGGEEEARFHVRFHGLN